MESKTLTRYAGGKTLLSYQTSRVVYEVTVIFCNRFLNYRDRTVDQMLQAARSGRQKIAKSSMVSGASWKMEIKLTNAARASLEELLENYQDYLRTHRHRVWRRSSPEAIHMRRITRNLKETEPSILDLARTRKAAEVCNMAICLINQIHHLLDRHLLKQDRIPLSPGGIRERTYHARRLAR